MVSTTFETSKKKHHKYSIFYLEASFLGSLITIFRGYKMDEGKKESNLISPAAFVEGGIQEACEDSCSICLESFCDNDPGTMTSCKHEFHLQCILEWCQRSSNCPMCWQAISLKDPSSQELLDAVEQERRFRFNPIRNSTIFHHPTLGDFELQHLPVGVNDSELEDRIIQHLAAAAAMGRTRQVARREGLRNRSATHNRPQFLVFSTNTNAPLGATISASTGPAQESGEQPSELVPHTSSVAGQDRAGPSESQAFSDSWKTRFGAISTKYKETLSKSTRGWKDRFFNKSPSMSNIGSEVRREVNSGIANMSRIIERLEIRENDHDSSSSNVAERVSNAGESDRNRFGTAGVSGSN